MRWKWGYKIYRKTAKTELINSKLFEQDDRKKEFVRLISQSLINLGYIETAELLEKEAGVKIENDNISEFRDLVIRGKWKNVIDALIHFNIPNKSLMCAK